MEAVGIIHVNIFKEKEQGPGPTMIVVVVLMDAARLAIVVYSLSMQSAPKFSKFTKA